MMKISEILLTYKTDKASQHSYGPFYDELFEKYDRDAKINILELGVQAGGSLLAWKDYFKNANVYGIDISDSRFDEYKKDTVYYETCDLRLGVDKFKDIKFDIIIDDSDHFIGTQMFIVKNYFPLLKEGGTLVIEDVQSADDDVSFIRGILPTGADMRVTDLRSMRGRYDDFIIEIKNGVIR